MPEPDVSTLTQPRLWKTFDAVDARDELAGVGSSIDTVLNRCEREGWTIFSVVTTPFMFKVIVWRSRPEAIR